MGYSLRNKSKTADAAAPAAPARAKKASPANKDKAAAPARVDTAAPPESPATAKASASPKKATSPTKAASPAKAKAKAKSPTRAVKKTVPTKPVPTAGGGKKALAGAVSRNPRLKQAVVKELLLLHADAPSAVASKVHMKEKKQLVNTEVVKKALVKEIGAHSWKLKHVAAK